MTGSGDVAELEESIGRVIAPYVGETMARASVRAHCERLGFGAGQLSDAQLNQLVEKIHAGLNVFVGREKAEQISAEILQTLRSGS